MRTISQEKEMKVSKLEMKMIDHKQKTIKMSQKKLLEEFNQGSGYKWMCKTVIYLYTSSEAKKEN